MKTRVFHDVIKGDRARDVNTEPGRVKLLWLFSFTFAWRSVQERRSRGRAAL